MEEPQQDLGEPSELVSVIGEILEKHNPTPATKEQMPFYIQQGKKVYFSNSDIQYMTTKYGLEPKFIARALRSFGEPVVLESLRRWEHGWQFEKDRARAVFWRICQAVESVGKEG
jgi:hypothetical protein